MIGELTWASGKRACAVTGDMLGAAEPVLRQDDGRERRTHLLFGGRVDAVVPPIGLGNNQAAASNNLLGEDFAARGVAKLRRLGPIGIGLVQPKVEQPKTAARIATEAKRSILIGGEYKAATESGRNRYRRPIANRPGEDAGHADAGEATPRRLPVEATPTHVRRRRAGRNVACRPSGGYRCSSTPHP